MYLPYEYLGTHSHVINNGVGGLAMAVEINIRVEFIFLGYQLMVTKVGY